MALFDRNVQYIIMIAMFVIAYIYCIMVATYIQRNQDTSPLYKAINDLHESCLLPCEAETCKTLTSQRGSNYYIGATSEERKDQLGTCLFTYWSLQHFLFFFALGFLTPDLMFEALSIGLLFEIYEYYRFDCHDVLDLLLNTLGFLAGNYLARTWT